MSLALVNFPNCSIRIVQSDSFFTRPFSIYVKKKLNIDNPSWKKRYCRYEKIFKIFFFVLLCSTKYKYIENLKRIFFFNNIELLRQQKMEKSHRRSVVPSRVKVCYFFSVTVKRSTVSMIYARRLSVQYVGPTFSIGAKSLKMLAPFYTGQYSPSHE